MQTIATATSSGQYTVVDSHSGRVIAANVSWDEAQQWAAQSERAVVR